MTTLEGFRIEEGEKVHLVSGNIEFGEFKGSGCVLV